MVLVVSVKDQGIGLVAGDAQALFKPFSKIKK